MSRPNFGVRRKRPNPPFTDAEDVRSSRLRIGMTQEEFASQLGVASSSVQNWEAGRTRPHRGTMARIKKLAEESPPVTPPPTRQRLHDDMRTAVDLIVERAPREMVRAVADYLFERAGRYGWAK